MMIARGSAPDFPAVLRELAESEARIARLTASLARPTRNRLVLMGRARQESELHSLTHRARTLRAALPQPTREK